MIRFNHFNFNVVDLDRSLTFYRDALGLEPVLDAGLRLGEGTGAVAAMPLLDMALSVYGEMHTFDGLGIPAYRADGRSPEEGEP